MSEREVFTRPPRCFVSVGIGWRCTCSKCSYADGYEAARQEAMALHLGTIDYLASARPPRRIPTILALRQLTEVLDKLGDDTFGAEDWASFKAELRRRTKEQAN